MRKLTWGFVVQKRTKNFLERLLFYTQESFDSNFFWENIESNRPKLIITTKRRFIEKLCELKRDQFYEAIKILKRMEILEDRRRRRQGSEEWYFALKLWSTDPVKNLNQFDLEWENCKPKSTKIQITSTTKNINESIDRSFVPNYLNSIVTISDGFSSYIVNHKVTRT